jgi:spectinomycin phosphotransferase
VKDRPVGFDERQLFGALGEGWGVAVHGVNYLAAGFGSYHWVVVDEDQQRFFVTVDDLDRKGWLGDTWDSAFAGLRRAFDAALDLRVRGGLEFVLAPLPTLAGETVQRMGRRHSIALFPYLDGAAGVFGDDISSGQRGDVVRLLVELHRSTPTASLVAQPVNLDFAGRDGLEAAMKDLDSTWRGGPFAEPARAWLAGCAGDLGRLLTDFDQLMAEVATADRAPVITHGEPHPGNVLRGHDGLVLIDWDTVRLAPPERDLWLVASASGEEAALYAEATGHVVSQPAMSLYRLAWELTDIAVYLDQFRSPHHRTQDTEDAWLNLTRTVGFDERSAVRARPTRR